MMSVWFILESKTSIYLIRTGPPGFENGTEKDVTLLVISVTMFLRTAVLNVVL